MEREKFLLKESDKSFWMFHSIFWFVHLIFYLIVGPSGQSSGNWYLVYVVYTFTAMVYSFIIRYVFKKFSVHKFTLVPVSITILLFALICGNLLAFSGRFIMYYLVPTDQFPYFKNAVEYSIKIWSVSYVYATYGIIYVLLQIRRDLISEKLRVDRTDSLYREAQLNLLRYQINPHFLFNVLNSIRSLIHEGRSEAEYMLNELSEFLKFSLFTRKQKEIPLSEELDMLNHYFAVEKIRFEDNLKIEMDIDPMSEDYPVPPLILQPIIENAIKYGKETSEIPLEITISTKVIDDVLNVDIINSGEWVEARKSSIKGFENKTGTGIENVKERLAYTYMNNYKFSLEHKKGKVKAHLELYKKCNE